MGRELTKKYLTKTKTILFFVSLFAIFIFSGKAHAAFNSSLIIPDAQFASYTTMSQQDIQNFLANKGSYLANYTETRDAYVGPNNDIDTKGWSASRIIWQCANWYGLNPQAIIATLQKEQSLITTSTLNQYGIDWAMGYGVPDSGAMDYSKQGFSMQVDWATWQLRWNMDRANSGDSAQLAKVYPYTTGNTVAIDGVNTWLGNGATASLYRYTPHFHGNQNFYLFYTSWFNYNQYVQDNLKLTSSLTLSNYNAAVGEKVADSFTLRNYLPTSITLDRLVISGRDPLGNPVDYPIHYNVTLAAYGDSNGGDILNISDSRSFVSAGVHSVWVSYYYNGQWFSVTPNSGQTNYMTFNVHVPNLSVTSFYFTPGTPTVGQNITATYAVKNNETHDVTVDVLSVGNHLTSQWYPSLDFGGYTGITIPAGQTVTYNVQRTLSTPGLYVASVSAKTGNYWNELNWGNGVSSKSYYNVIPYSDGVKAVLPLTFSDSSPAIGETVTSSFRLRNKTTMPLTLDRVVVTGRTPSWAPVDFPVQFNVTLAPYGDSSGNDFYSPPQMALRFQDANTYNFWISYLYQGTWYNVKPDTNQVTSLSVASHVPNLSVTSFYFTPGTPTVGQNITATYAVKNNETHDVTVDVLSIGNHLTTQWYPSLDFGGYTGITIPAGQTVTYNVQRTLSTPGLYVASVSAKTGNVWSELNWGNGVSSKSYYWVK